jgi:hypothetical protein
MEPGDGLEEADAMRACTVVAANVPPDCVKVTALEKVVPLVETSNPEGAETTTLAVKDLPET